ncbi:hypothetical protein ILP92_11025 [Maribius pontilimi]|uniref:Uncharacterized protein n=1 Tax=Palleronia pontilimi TaxID=1964209 RepID=A0A934MHF6_9RHOB|nr:hypothetical protein [Palleronia pontilimi]MBJ3763279.1 hypothetical protein [Palleronia pontilimi]
MPNHGPGKGELVFRLAFSLVGLGVLVVALLVRGIPAGPAFFEVIVLAGGFFGASAIWTLLRLKSRD